MKMTISWMSFFFILLMSCEKMTPPPVMDDSNLPNLKFYFSSNEEGYNELGHYQDGKVDIIKSDPTFDYWWPKVHPSKSYLIVYRSPANPDKDHDAYQEAELVKMNMDGTGEQVLIEKGQYGWRAQGIARWNHNGTKILMGAEIEQNDTYQWRLVHTDSDGTNPNILSHFWAIDCNYSPDNQSIVFMGFPDNKLSFDLTNLELMHGDYDESMDTVINIVPLTKNDTRDHDPEYNPTGDQIVFSGGNAFYSNVDLKLYNTVTKTETILWDDDAANGGSMCWTPDGQYIVYHSLHLFKSPFVIKAIEVSTRKPFTILESGAKNFGYFHPETY